MKWSRLNPTSPESYWKKRPLPSTTILPDIQTPVTASSLQCSSASTGSSADLLLAIIGSRNSFSAGPKVQQYMFTRTQQSQTKASLSVSQHCFICHESIRYALDGELPVPLCCGDVVHGQCFDLALQSTSDNKLPICRGFNCLQHKKVLQLKPKDENLLELTFTRILMSTDLNVSQGQSIPGIHRAPHQHLSNFVIDQTSTVSDTDNGLFCSFDFKYDGDTDTQIDNIGFENDSKTQTATVDSLTQFLIHKDPTIDVNFLATCGKLRLADILLVSREVEHEVPHYCYLYERELVILGGQRKPLLVIPLTHSRCFILDKLLLTWSQPGQEHQYEIKLGAQSSQLVEKWAIAMSDRNFIFPLVLLSSSIDVFLDDRLDTEKSSLEQRLLLDLESSEFGVLMSPFLDHIELGPISSGVSFEMETQEKGHESSNNRDTDTIHTEVPKFESKFETVYSVSSHIICGQEDNGGHHSPDCLLDHFELHDSLIGQEVDLSEFGVDQRMTPRIVDLTSIYSDPEPNSLETGLGSDESDSDSDADQIDTFLQPRVKRLWDNLIDTVQQAISNAM